VAGNSTSHHSTSRHRHHRRHRRARRRIRTATAVVGALAAIAVVGAAIVWIGSDAMLSRRHESPMRALAIPSDAAAIAEGSRLATLLGCQDACHGPGLAGAVVRDDDEIGRVVAPDLRRVATEYTDAELERVIRRGVRRDGSSVFAMPVASHAELADDDTARIIAFLRSAQASAGSARAKPEAAISPTPRGRLAILAGALPPAAETVHHELQAPPAHSPHEPEARAAYLARTACGECHGVDLRGRSEIGTPDLALIDLYPHEAFARLLRTGQVHGERSVRHAPSGSGTRFAPLTDEEIAALEAYLRDRGVVSRTTGG
jgi:cytochrome c553